MIHAPEERATPAPGRGSTTIEAERRIRRFHARAAAVTGGGAALALALLAWIFWDPVYEFSINPQDPFLTGRPPDAPAYAAPDAWAALPGRMDGADLGPPGGTALPAAPPSADVFFIHPTTSDSDVGWNLDVTGDPGQNVNRVAGPLLASVFSSGVRLYAPRYRQATYYAFRTRSEDARLAHHFAHDDVRRAFRRYLTDWNRGRPFVLAGVGQGALHLTGLLQDPVLSDQARQRLIAAYVIGAPVPADMVGLGAALALPACVGPEHTGCIVSWSAYPWGASARKLTDRTLIFHGGDLEAVAERPLLCVNPLSWRLDGAPVLRDVNGGSLPLRRIRRMTALPALVPGAAGAQCVDGILRVDRPADRRLRRALLPGRPHETLDVALFYDSIRRNLRARIAAFNAQQGSAESPGE